MNAFFVTLMFELAMMWKYLTGNRDIAEDDDV